jgi:hypothetical protein
VNAYNSIAKAETIRVLLGPAGWLLFVFFVVGVVTLIALDRVAAIPIALGLAVSFLTLGCVVFALRHYMWLWFLCWFIPFVPVLALLEPIRVGAMSPIAVVFVYLLAYAITFGIIVLGRKRFLKWVQ